MHLAKCILVMQRNYVLKLPEKLGRIIHKFSLPGGEGSFCILSVERLLCYSGYLFGPCIKLSSAEIDDQHKIAQPICSSI